MHTGHLRRAAQGLIVLILLGFLLIKLHLLVLPGGSRVLSVLILVVCSTVYWWAWVDERLRASMAAGRSGQNRLRWLWAGYTVATILPILAALTVGRWTWDALPIPVLAWMMLWHLLLVGLASLVALGSTLLAAAAWLRPARAGEDLPVDLSRRDFLAAAGMAAPILLTGGGLGASLVQSGRFRIHRVELALPRLPSRLRGLTITHLSDLHVGRLFRPEHLPALVDAVNALRSDMVVFTGDLVDHSNAFLPACCDALGAMEHRYGRFIIAGNHDLIDSGREFLRYVGRREPGLLIDAHAQREIGGEPIQIAGLFWSGYEKAIGSSLGHRDRAERALSGCDSDVFTIALAHHPHTFDPLVERGVDLTLAGHTHGGQIMFTPPGAEMPLGAGSLLFRYIWGEYRRGRSAMFVTAGAGNWFPLRVNAPAEVVHIRLL